MARPTKTSTQIAKSTKTRGEDAPAGRGSRRNAATPAANPVPPLRQRRRPDLDDADRQLISLLTADGRRSNRALAGEVGLTEPTVAARLRSLSERHILGVTASLDWAAAGYRWDAWLQISVEGRSVREVMTDVADVDGVHQVHIVFGPFDLFAHLLLQDASEAIDAIGGKIATIAGITSVRPNVTLETVKFATKHARVPIQPIALRFPDPVVGLDDLDRALIDLLLVDGRQSNRRAARKLGVSEGTVRQRLRRLEDAGLLRITARSDPYLTGEINAWAFVGIDTERGSTRDVAHALAELDETGLVAITAGANDLLASVQVVSRSRLTDLVLEDLRAMSGVRSTSTWEIVHSWAPSYQWARLLP